MNASLFCSPFRYPVRGTSKRKSGAQQRKARKARNHAAAALRIQRKACEQTEEEKRVYWGGKRYASKMAAFHRGMKKMGLHTARPNLEQYVDSIMRNATPTLVALPVNPRDVYLMRSATYPSIWKIGVSSDPANRQDSLSSSDKHYVSFAPWMIVAKHMADYPFRTEHRTHVHFAQYRMNSSREVFLFPANYDVKQEFDAFVVADH